MAWFLLISIISIVYYYFLAFNPLLYCVCVCVCVCVAGVIQLSVQLWCCMATCYNHQDATWCCLVHQQPE